ncbi:FMN phosphatase YigB, HAD superfamily [Natronincola peptidivorans]|uniref:FMN phosphatase YigB, HAD superfamily n=1 Tax=Natronincola peptidivorans TaxID=426128 RepID=A0A1I0D535_9FIRM|nr:HAD family hydrolase [Natronincola peptidivorans]SET27326.1 FMN phosphatase YigB, HAD superfamily [Natronincola peptidivorans]
MIKTILFDLDGTLLPLNMEDFLKRYFEELGMKFQNLIHPKELAKLVWGSTEYMVKNIDKEKTNAEAFFEDFFSKVSHKPEELNPIFDDFYINDFPKIKETASQNQNIIDAITILKEKGYELVVATNPLFPKLAILHRIQWAGLNKEDFVFITSFEEMHYCKPHIHFYEEILEKINRRPEECMMVGNDVEEDMVAKKLGIKTYLIEDYKIQRSQKIEGIDYIGKYEDFYEFVKTLPSI